MTGRIRTGDVVRMTRDFRDTLDRDEARRESRRRYTVAAVRRMADGTGLVDFVRRGRQQCSGAALGYVERA